MEQKEGSKQALRARGIGLLSVQLPVKLFWSEEYVKHTLHRKISGSATRILKNQTSYHEQLPAVNATTLSGAKHVDKACMLAYMHIVDQTSA